jgi:hypothetical protein
MGRENLALAMPAARPVLTPKKGCGKHPHMSEAHATDPNEPKTPMWLTALGGVLFLLAGLAWALRTPTPDATDTTAPAGSAAVDAGK